jgi:prophage antirepressor-like protein
METKIFKSPQFGEIRTTGTSEQPLFCLADLCRILGLQSTEVNRRLENGVVSKHPIVDNLGRTQQALFVNEDGLYDVILDSRKPEAKAFRKWVTSEVLPAIRRTGGYMAARADETPEQIMARALLVAQDTINRHKQRVQMLEGENEHLVSEVKQQALKVLFADAEKFYRKNFVDTEKVRTFALEHYNIKSWAKNQTNFLNKIKGNPLWWRLGNCPQPQTPSVCCDVHTYGGFLLYHNSIRYEHE